MTPRENPATVFMARQIGEHVEQVPWREMSRDQQFYWLNTAFLMVTAMYDAGFTIPQPENPDAVWDELKAGVS